MIVNTNSFIKYFYTDDGVRLIVNGVMIIDNYTAHAATTNTGAIYLIAGQYYSIKLQFEEITGYEIGRRDRGVREEREG